MVESISLKWINSPGLASTLMSLHYIHFLYMVTDCCHQVNPESLVYQAPLQPQEEHT